MWEVMWFCLQNESATNPTKLWLWVHSGWDVLTDFSLLSTRSPPPPPPPDSRSKKFTWVSRVMERYLKWQRRSLRGRGGGGGLVEMRNEMEPINSCQLSWIWLDARTTSSQMRTIVFLWEDIKMFNTVFTNWILNKHARKTQCGCYCSTLTPDGHSGTTYIKMFVWILLKMATV